MKPIVLYHKDKDGHIVITENDIQKLIDVVYDQGYADGLKANTFNNLISTQDTVPTWLGTPVPNETPQVTT